MNTQWGPQGTETTPVAEACTTPLFVPTDGVDDAQCVLHARSREAGLLFYGCLPLQERLLLATS